ncbi:MAG: DUF4129 domain-containing protein [Bacteroidia bacterium]
MKNPLFIFFVLIILIIKPVAVAAQEFIEEEEEFEELENSEFEEVEYEEAERALDFYETETPDPGPVKAFDNAQYRKATEGLEYGTEEQPDAETGTKTVQRTTSLPQGVVTSFQILVALLIAGLLIFILVRTISRIGGPANKKLRAQETMGGILQPDNPHEAPLEAMLKKALSAGDTRQALRIYYLMLIRQLSEKGWITWKREKTNFDYLRETSSRNGNQTFRELTLIFERYWYGNAKLPLETYERLSAKFEAFIRQVKEGTAA